jgi:membrane carboxypeptidase/penicillin-binding protein
MKKHSEKILPFTEEEFGQFANRIIGIPSKVTPFSVSVERAQIARDFLLERVRKAYSLEQIDRDKAIRLSTVVYHSFNSKYPPAEYVESVCLNGVETVVLNALKNEERK